MSPLNRGPPMGPIQGPRVPPVGMRLPMPRFTRGPPMLPGMGRVPPPPPGMFGPPRGRPIPPMPGRIGPMMPRSVPVMPPMYEMRGRLMPPMPPLQPMPMRVTPMGLRGPMMRPGPRGVLPPNALPHMKPRFPINNKAKSNSPKKNNKMEDLELKKPWMTDEIRCEIQKKNKLYAKAKKNKDAKEWEEFKDLRNKVTRMIRDAKNEYLTKNPDQVAQKTAEKKVDNENVQKTDNTTEQTEQTEQMEINGEDKPSSEQAQS